MRMLFHRGSEEIEFVPWDSLVGFPDAKTAEDFLRRVAPHAKKEWYEETAGKLLHGELALVRRDLSSGSPEAKPEEPKPAKPVQPVKKDRVPKELFIRLDINPNDASTHDDKFLVTGSDGYRCEKTVKDDQTPGDDYVDLHYKGLYEGETYSLEILDAPNAAPYSIFRDVPYEELVGLSPDGDEESAPPEEEEPPPEDFDTEVE